MKRRRRRRKTGLVLLSIKICFKLKKQLLDWDPSRVIFSAYPESELGRRNKVSISPRDGKGCSERNGVHSAEVIPPLSPLSHQPTPRGARRLPAQELPEQLKVQTPPALHSRPAALTAQRGLGGSSCFHPCCPAPGRALGDCPQPLGSPGPPALGAAAPALPAALSPRQGAAPAAQAEPAPWPRHSRGRQRFRAPVQRPSWPGRSFRERRPPACVTGMRGVLCLVTVT